MQLINIIRGIGIRGSRSPPPSHRHSVQSFTSIEIPAEITLNEKLRVQVETKKLWTRGRMEIFQLT